MIQETEAAQKLPYVKPSLRSIELITEEVLAANCKVGATDCEDIGGPISLPGS